MGGKNTLREGLSLRGLVVFFPFVLTVWFHTADLRVHASPGLSECERRNPITPTFLRFLQFPAVSSKNWAIWVKVDPRNPKPLEPEKPSSPSDCFWPTQEELRASQEACASLQEQLQDRCFCGVIVGGLGFWLYYSYWRSLKNFSHSSFRLLC